MRDIDLARQAASDWPEIGAGDRVTIVNQFGQQQTGRVVMAGPAGWVLNVGGAHGTAKIASNQNIVKVRKGRKQ